MSSSQKSACLIHHPVNPVLPLSSTPHLLLPVCLQCALLQCLPHPLCTALTLREIFALKCLRDESSQQALQQCLTWPVMLRVIRWYSSCASLALILSSRATSSGFWGRHRPTVRPGSRRLLSRLPAGPDLPAAAPAPRAGGSRILPAARVGAAETLQAGHGAVTARSQRDPGAPAQRGLPASRSAACSLRSRLNGTRPPSAASAASNSSLSAAGSAANSPARSALRSRGPALTDDAMLGPAGVAGATESGAVEGGTIETAGWGGAARCERGGAERRGPRGALWAAGGGMSGGAARRYVAAALGRARARGPPPLWEPPPARHLRALGTGGAAAALPLLLPPRRHLSSR